MLPRSPRFNPHPPLRADATGLSGCRGPHHVGVSILTHPYGRMQLDGGGCGCARGRDVSILTHPYGRMQLCKRPSPKTVRASFQSSPTLTGGCNPAHRPGLHRPARGFNPHPPLRADATGQPGSRLWACTWFQSSPTLTGGCNRHRRTAKRWLRSRFNPHPPLRADATLRDSMCAACDSMFQSSPTLTGGCNPAFLPPCESGHGVSILTHPYGRMQLRGRARPTCRSSTFQSSPTLTGGCNSKPSRPSHEHTAGFNPHPPLRADAT